MEHFRLHIQKISRLSVTSPGWNRAPVIHARTTPTWFTFAIMNAQSYGIQRRVGSQTVWKPSAVLVQSLAAAFKSPVMLRTTSASSLLLCCSRSDSLKTVGGFVLGLFLFCFCHIVSLLWIINRSYFKKKFLHISQAWYISYLQA